MKQAPPVGPTLVHVVRHGEVDNPQGVLYGRLPGFHLSANGYAMAERLGEFFADVPLRRLVASPLTRAQETIAPIARRRDLEVVLDQRVIEAGNRFEGQKFGKDNAALKNPRNWWLLRNPVVPSWGEPYKQVAERMVAAISDAAAQAGEDGRAVIVSHQLPIWIGRLAFERRRFMHDPRKRQCTVGSVSTFVFHGSQFVRVDYAEPCKDLLRAGVRGDTISTGGSADADDAANAAAEQVRHEPGGPQGPAS